MKHSSFYICNRAAFLSALLFLFFPCSTTYAQQQTHGVPSLKPAVEIEALEVAGQPLPGQPFEVEVRYRAHIDREATLFLRVPQSGEMRLVNAPIGEHTVRRPVMLRTGQIQTQTFDLEIDKAGYMMIQVTLTVSEAPPGYSRSAHRYLKVKSTPTSFEVFDPRQPGDAEPKVIGRDVRHYRGIRPPSQQGQQQGSQQYTVSITGKIQTYQEDEDRDAGVYGNGVALWFRDSSDPDTWYHPVLGNIEGTHYDLLDEQGNFAFNFGFTGDLSGYDEAIVLVNTANRATVMPAPQDGYIVWYGNSYTAYFNEETEGVVLPINGSNANITAGGNGTINTVSGNILRYLTLSREFLEQRYGGSLPFSLPIVQTLKEELSGACGLFSVNFSDPINWFYENIKIDPDCAEFTTTSHEYGHWINYNLWEGDVLEWGVADNTVQEGWAIFYSFATRNYGNEAYGDALRVWDDNPEEDAFVDSPFRYFGTRYASGGHPENAAAASYFWSLYDGYSGGSYEMPIYDTGDNDDLSGYGLRIFEKMDEVDGNLIDWQDMGDYHDTFKSGLSTEIKTSVNKVYDFMFSDLDDIPTKPMRPAQVTAASAQLSGSQVTLSWTDQTYASSPFYGNEPTGYKLYKKSGGSWNLLTSLTYGTNSYIDANGSISDQYKITSYNSAGEANTAPVVQPITASISGPSTVAYYQSHTWTSNVTGGASPYSYLWEFMPECPGGGGGLAPQCDAWNHGSYGSSFTYTSTDGYNFTIRLTVTDDDASTAIATKYVVVTGAPKRGDQTTTEETTASIPTSYALLQNYPNPFNPATEIRFALPEAGVVSLVIYDVMGREVARLVEGSLGAGYHRVGWDAARLPSGVYLYRLRAGSFVAMRRMVLLQ